MLSTDRSNHSHLHMNLYKISIFPLCVTPSNDFAVSQSVTVAYFIFGNIGIRIIFCIRTAFAFICTSTATYIAAFYSIHCSGIKLILLKCVKSDFSHDCYRFCVINFFCLPVAIRNEFPYLFPCSILSVCPSCHTVYRSGLAPCSGDQCVIRACTGSGTSQACHYRGQA